MSETNKPAPVQEEGLETLDPGDWQAMRRLAHRMIDDAFEDVRNVRDRPAWRAMPDGHRDRFTLPRPREPQGAEEAYRAYRDDVAPYRMGNDHPRFWAYYMGNGNVMGALSEFLAAMDASNLGGGASAAAEVERQVVAWTGEILGFPEDASGLMTSGASMANLMALAVARNGAADADVRRDGVAAVGAPVKLAPTASHLVDGMERADSVALDLHKWMHTPFEAGVVLVRHADAHRATFTLMPEYLERTARGLAGDASWFSDYGPQLSRGFKALKVWMALKEHGANRFGRLIERNIDQAHHLAHRLSATDTMEVVAPVVLDVVCFRVRPAGVADDRLDAFHDELVLRIQESGEAVPSNTTLHGRRCMRVAFCNHRASFEDVDRFVGVLEPMADRLAVEFREVSSRHREEQREA